MRELPNFPITLVKEKGGFNVGIRGELYEWELTGDELTLADIHLRDKSSPFLQVVMVILLIKPHWFPKILL